MRLEELTIRRRDFGKNAGKFTGSIKFSNKLGEVAISLSPEQGQGSKDCFSAGRDL